MSLKQIVLTGNHGIGKTTLAKELSNRMNVGYVSYSTRKNMPLSLTTHRDIIRLGNILPDKGIEFQSDLIQNRLQVFKDWFDRSYISDRAVVDSYVYYLMHNSMYDTEEHNTLLYNEAKESIKASQTFVLYIVPNLEIEDDSVRITNKYYAEVFNILNRHYFVNLVEEYLGDKLTRLSTKYNDSCRAIKYVNKETSEIKLLLITETEQQSVDNRIDFLNKELKLGL